MNSPTTIPIKPLTGCTPSKQLARQVRLDELYAQDGRHYPDHESHGLYTGLWDKYVGTPYTDEEPLA